MITTRAPDGANKKVFNEKFSLRGGGVRQMHVRFHWAIPEIK